MAESILISYVEKKSYIHKLNPLTKSVVVLFAVLLSLFLGNYIHLLIVFFLIIPFAYMAKLLRYIFKPIKLLLPFFIILFLIQGLFYPERQTVLFTLPFNIQFWTEGLEFAALISARLLVMFVYGYLFILTTHPGDLVTSLREIKLPHRVLRMPYSFGYIILATLQMIPRMQAQMATITEAQISRGLEIHGSIINKLKAYIPLTGPLFLSSVQQAVERSIALESRAFSSDCLKTSFRKTIMRKNDYIIMISAMILSILGGVLSWLL
jgi:energy-coupling factor transport system permease protein